MTSDDIFDIFLSKRLFEIVNFHRVFFCSSFQVRSVKWSLRLAVVCRVRQAVPTPAATPGPAPEKTYARNAYKIPSISLMLPYR